MQRYLILLAFLMAGGTGLYAGAVISETGAPTGNFINLKTEFGTTFVAYASGDENAQNGILLIPDKWGLDQQVRSQADHLAELGYRALAVDLYDSRQVSDAEMADEVYRSIDPVWTDANLKGALDYLKRSQRNIASMGWGTGAEHALILALQEPQEISAVVAYYGVPITDDQLLNALNGPMLAIFANRDIRIDNKKIAAFEESMAVLGKKLVELKLDVDHGFANPRTKSYNEQASNEAWDATRDFLAKHLAVSGKN